MLEVGHQISHYRLDGELSSSAKSKVFLASDVETRTRVAIKTAQPGAGENELAHESRLLQRIHHPNVVQVLALDKTADGSPYLILEYVEGIALNEIVPKDKGLDFKSVWPILIQLGAGLESIHHAGVVHLDLRPSNILLMRKPGHSDVVKIVDFGIAEELGQSTSPAHKPHGTPGYVAPERILQTGRPDIRCDVYSFGALLAFLLTGKRPFAGHSPEEILAKQLSSRPSVIDQSYLGQSQTLKHIVLRATQLNPDNRYNNIAEIMQALSAYQRSLSMQSNPNEPQEEKDPSEDPAQTQVGHFVVGAAVIGVLIVVALIYYFLFNSV